MNSNDLLTIIKNKILEHKLITNNQPKLIIISSDFIGKPFSSNIKDITKYKVSQIDNTYIKFPEIEGSKSIEDWTFYLYDIKLMITDRPNTIEVY